MAAAPRPSTSSDSRQPSAASDWSRVARLRPGAMIHLTTTGSPQVRRHVVRADDVTLTVLDVAHPALTDGVGKRLLEIAVEHPSALMQARQIAMFVWGDLRIGPDGLFVAGRKILNLDEILVTVPLSDVLQVSRPERRGSRWGALAGGIAGAIIGTRLGVLSLYNACSGVCVDENLLTLAWFVGLPIGASVLGNHANIRTVDAIGYRASPQPVPEPSSLRDESALGETSAETVTFVYCDHDQHAGRRDREAGGASAGRARPCSPLAASRARGRRAVGPVV